MGFLLYTATMALIGVSLIVASVVLFCLRRPAWLPNFFANLCHQRSIPRPRDNDAAGANGKTVPEVKEPGATENTQHDEEEEKKKKKKEDKKVKEVAHQGGDGEEAGEEEQGVDEDQPTPKACATGGDHDAVPSFSLSEPSTADEPAIRIQQPSASTSMMPPPPPPPPPPRVPRATPGPQTPSLMAPPPVPTPRRIPTLAPTSNTATTSSSSLRPTPNRSLLSTPNRQPGSSTLAPPPTHSSIPKKPSRQVTLEPGHSPMDWARLAQSPTSDLRGLPPATPYLRITPSELRHMTGRKGKDAWCALGGKVYNFTPYIPFHPGGEAELLRGAGRDGTRMFGEVHPWVNYETMLSACLIGILVDEHDVKSEVGSKMEEMD